MIGHDTRRHDHEERARSRRKPRVFGTTARDGGVTVLLILGELAGG
jgi:hypothetical protein